MYSDFNSWHLSSFGVKPHSDLVAWLSDFPDGMDAGPGHVFGGDEMIENTLNNLSWLDLGFIVAGFDSHGGLLLLRALDGKLFAIEGFAGGGAGSFVCSATFHDLSSFRRWLTVM